MRHSLKQLVTLSMVVCATTVFGQAPSGAVPATVTKAFQQAYPGATISGTTPERENDRPLYRVNGVDKGRRRAALYDASGKVIEAVEQVEEKELPKPVADALHSHRRAIYVTGMRVTRGADVTYQLTARGSRKTAMVVKADGTVLSWK